MAPPRTWLDRADEILEVLRAMRSPALDRTAIEELFQLQRRSAVELMNQAGVTKQRGFPSLLDRTKLTAWVEGIIKMEGAEIERRRSTSEELSRATEEVRAVRAALHKEGRPPISFPVVEQILQTTFDSLPSSIRVEPGRITVEFPADDPVEAVRQLYTLAMAVANDLATFELMATPLPCRAREEDLVHV